jgi:hypothetical protein
LRCDGKHLFAANGLSGDVTVIDLSANIADRDDPARRQALGRGGDAMKRLLLAGAAPVRCALHARELRVCADPNNLPFSNAAGEGFENKIIALLAKDLGAEVRTPGGRSAAAPCATRSTPATATSSRAWPAAAWT